MVSRALLVIPPLLVDDPLKPLIDGFLPNMVKERPVDLDKDRESPPKTVGSSQHHFHRTKLCITFLISFVQMVLWVCVRRRSRKKTFVSLVQKRWSSPLEIASS